MLQLYFNKINRKKVNIMKNKLKVLMSGVLALSMVITITPASLLANEIPSGIIATTESSAIPTEIMALNDNLADGKYYDFSNKTVEYSPHIYTTTTGVLKVMLDSRGLEWQYFNVKLHNATTGEVEQTFEAATVNTNLGLVYFNNLDKNEKYYIELENITPIELNPNVAGNFIISTH